MEDSNRDMLSFLECFGYISESIIAGKLDLEVDFRSIKTDCSSQIAQLQQTCKGVGVKLNVLV
ncbi:hypothetical protein HNW13_018325 [Shewanella sp. BF02_Schw]|uniref:hypothetical protein n=1 Tax=Shewanella sp. BF02_Schw TaxID=394908 RepID=UPI0017832ADD|nr:hypothetical protein [Shewanella sp. BF02_Schw]MBO1897698.1 hypothetical protein [Shewanella sp. BF02_Schw]